MSPTFERIAVGDLVQIIRACCSNHRRLGHIYSVLEIEPGETKHKLSSGGCGASHPGPCAHVEREELSGWIPLEWLKRIPPLSELEGERTEENLKEPA